MNKFSLVPVAPFALALLIGIAVADEWPQLGQLYSLLLAFIALLISSLLYYREKYTAWPLVIATFLAGYAVEQINEEFLNITPCEKYKNYKIIIVDEAKPNDRYNVYNALVCDSTLKGKKMRCNVEKSIQPLLLGATYDVRTRIRKFENYGKPSNFDFVRWTKSQSLVGQMYVYPGNIKGTHHTEGEIGFFDLVKLKTKIFRNEILHSLHLDNINSESKALISAMAFGDKSKISPEARAQYSRTGLSHLLALSGMHLGILVVLLSMVFVHRRTFLLGKALVLIAIWVYVFIVGMPTSVVRAATMLTLYSILTLDRRQPASLNTLCATAFIMLLFNPMQLWDIGFQMSFASLLGIFLLSEPLYGIINEQILFRLPLLRRAWRFLCVCIAAQMATAPLSAYYFGTFSTIFLLSNIIAIPLVTILLYVVFFAVVTIPVHSVSMLFIWFAGTIATLLNNTVSYISSWEYSCITGINMFKIDVILAYLIIIFVLLSLQMWSSRR